jgi:hypothetical protein
VKWLKEHGGIDGEFDSLIEGVRAQARVNGRECGVEFAEGFETLHDEAQQFLD